MHLVNVDKAATGQHRRTLSKPYKFYMNRTLNIVLMYYPLIISEQYVTHCDLKKMVPVITQ
jgi:hypothetical protein